MKKAAVYNRWLASLGGGEQVSFSFAEVLRDLGYKTDLITHSKVDLEAAEKKLDVDLHGINLRYLPQMSSNGVSKYTEEYDVFINTSQLDYFRNRSKKGILSIYFPEQIHIPAYEYLKRAIIIPCLKSFFVYPLEYENFAVDKYVKGEIHKGLKNESVVHFSTPVKSFNLKFFMGVASASHIDQIKFKVESKNPPDFKKKICQHDNTATFNFDLKEATHHVEIVGTLGQEKQDDIALIEVTIPSFRFKTYQAFKNLFPKWELKLHGIHEVIKKSNIESYRGIITNSGFTKKWVHNYWLMDSRVLYPPVNTENFTASKAKKNIISHVGRFFVSGHNKKQYELIDSFIKLITEHSIDDWELHLVGSVNPGQRNQDYFDQCVDAAKGYPIVFHQNASFEELKNLLGKSKIYWHATGLNENENEKPGLFEHFGITTVEAMASGCVPVVINAGGQPEIVNDTNGVLFNNATELIEKTNTLISNPVTLKEKSQKALMTSQKFSRKIFKTEFANIIEGK